MDPCILSYDIITSGCKASLYCVDGRLLAQHTVPLPMQFMGRHAQQSARDWYRALIESTRVVIDGMDPSAIACVSFTDQVQVCLPVDRDGEPLGDAITWSDVRSLEVADPFAAMDQEEYMRITGQRNTPSSSIRKLCWVREREPERWAATHKMLGCKDYLVLKLTGEWVTDHSDASSTGAFDIRRLDWSQELLERCGVDPVLMPRSVAPTQIVGRVSEKAAAETGLSTSTQVVMGSGDFTCSAVGAGCLEPGRLYWNIGSSSWVAAAAREPVTDPGMNLINCVHAVEGLYLPLASVQEAGVSFKWLRSLTGLGGEKQAFNPYQNVYPYDGVGELLRQSPPGANGLLFLPFLLGPTVGWHDERARGAYLGLHSSHGEADMARAAWEGVALYLERMARKLGDPQALDHILATGIASQERELLQVLADTHGVPVENTELDITVDAIGAAIIAGYAVGLYPDLDQARRFHRRSLRLEPAPALAEHYRQAREHFARGAELLREFCG